MRNRARRIPSWPGETLSNKGRIHLRRPTCHFHFSLAERRRTIHLLRPTGLVLLRPCGIHWLNWRMSLHFSLVAGNSIQRTVCRRLSPPPRSLSCLCCLTYIEKTPHFWAISASFFHQRISPATGILPGNRPFLRQRHRRSGFYKRLC
jgi:hypothetical protein